MNRLQLRTLTLSWLDDFLSGYFTESQVNVWLNNAQTEVQKRLIKAGQNYFLRCVKTTLVPSQRDYVLPSNLLKIHRLDVVTSGTAPNETAYPIIPVILNQVDFVPTGTGSPGVYVFKGGKVSIFPAPDVSYTMRLFYSWQVDDMTLDTDIPQVPQRYQELIALLAAQDGFLKDGRANELLLKKIDEYQKHFDSDAQERNIDFPRGVNQVGGGFDGDFYW